MTKVTIYRNKENRIQGYHIAGHADYDEKGKDIVCAAVSVLAQTTLLALVKVCKIKENEIKYSIDDKKGMLYVQISTGLDTNIRDKAETVFRTFEVGIQSIIEGYSKYVTLKYREV